MKRPLGLPCVLFIAGILLGDFLAWPFLLFFGLSVGLVVGTLVWTKGRTALLAGGIVAAGAVAMAFHARVPPDDVRRVVGAGPHLVTVRGRLVETPYQRFYEDRARSLSKLDCAGVRPKGGDWRRVTGRIAVVTPGTADDRLWHGQTVEITGVLAEPPPAFAPGLFDYRAHLRRLGIHYVLRAASDKDWVVLGSSEPTWAARFSRWAKRTLSRGLPDDDEAVQLLWAMTLGWKTALNGETTEPFMRSGTLHIFAISGLHIAMITAIFAGVLRGIRVPRRYCALIVIPAVWFYTSATGWQASAVRSAVMASVVFGGWLLVRPSDLLNSIAGAALIILACDPQQLFQPGFQLSFAVVFCLVLFGSCFKWLQDPIASGDPLIPWEIRPWWQRKWLTGVRYVAGLAITSVAAWLASLPLTAFYFHLFSPVSVLANLVVVPMSGAALASNLAALLFGSWAPFFTEVFNNSAWFWMKGMLRISEWAARWPGAAFHVAAPGLFTMAVYYLTLVGITARWFSAPTTRPWLWAITAALGMASAVEIAALHSRSTLTLLPMSGGHAVFVDAPGTSRDVLVDCGNEGGSRIVIKPFLQSRGVRRLASLVLTHGDVDHVGGFESIVETFDPRNIFGPAADFRSPYYRKALRLIEARGRRLQQLAPGRAVAGWAVLYPERQDHVARADDNALVLRGEIRGTTVLLVPDLSPAAQRVLAARSVELKSDVVIASLPEQGEPLLDELLDRIQPRIILMADAEYPPDARARAPLRERLARRGVPVLYASEAGAVTLEFGRNEAVIYSNRKKEPIRLPAR